MILEITPRKGITTDTPLSELEVGCWVVFLLDMCFYIGKHVVGTVTGRADIDITQYTF